MSGRHLRLHEPIAVLIGLCAQGLGSWAAEFTIPPSRIIPFIVAITFRGDAVLQHRTTSHVRAACRIPSLEQAAHEWRLLSPPCFGRPSRSSSVGPHTTRLLACWSPVLATGYRYRLLAFQLRGGEHGSMFRLFVAFKTPLGEVQTLLGLDDRKVFKRLVAFQKEPAPCPNRPA